MKPKAVTQNPNVQIGSLHRIRGCSLVLNTTVWWRYLVTYNLFAEIKTLVGEISFVVCKRLWGEHKGQFGQLLWLSWQSSASHTRGPRFESSHWQSFYIEHKFTFKCIEKEKGGRELRSIFNTKGCQWLRHTWRNGHFQHQWFSWVQNRPLVIFIWTRRLQETRHTNKEGFGH